MNLSNFFKDKDGNIVIGQFPNWPLWTAMAFWILRYLPCPALESISHWGMTIALLYWSYLEIRFGANGFRKLLGMAVLVWVFMQLG